MCLFSVVLFLFAVFISFSNPVVLTSFLLHARIYVDVLNFIEIIVSNEKVSNSLGHLTYEYTFIYISSENE